MIFISINLVKKNQHCQIKFQEKLIYGIKRICGGKRWENFIYSFRDPVNFGILKIPIHENQIFILEIVHEDI